ncbi:hypothetical protein C0993_007342, partial [Termitomyces sp. T159_Od127]
TLRTGEKAFVDPTAASVARARFNELLGPVEEHHAVRKAAGLAGLKLQTGIGAARSASEEAPIPPAPHAVAAASA